MCSVTQPLQTSSPTMPSASSVRSGGLGGTSAPLTWSLWRCPRAQGVTSWALILTTSFWAPCVCFLDFDDDGTLNREDLSQLVNCLTGESEDTRLSASEMKQLIDNVSSRGGWAGPGSRREGLGFGFEASPFQILEESDIDRDGTINLSEFQHVISRSPDFARYDCDPHLLHQVWGVISGGGPWGRKRPPASSEY